MKHHNLGLPFLKVFRNGKNAHGFGMTSFGVPSHFNDTSHTKHYIENQFRFFLETEKTNEKSINDDTDWTSKSRESDFQKMSDGLRLELGCVGKGGLGWAGWPAGLTGLAGLTIAAHDVHVHVYVYVKMCICICIYVYIYMYVHICIYICIFIYMYICTYIYIYTYIYSDMVFHM